MSDYPELSRFVQILFKFYPDRSRIKNWIIFGLIEFFQKSGYYQHKVEIKLNSALSRCLQNIS